MITKFVEEYITRIEILSTNVRVVCTIVHCNTNVCVLCMHEYIRVTAINIKTVSLMLIYMRDNNNKLNGNIYCDVISMFMYN